MARTRRPRLSWFRCYPDDFNGGVASMTAEEVGCYWLMLLAQWSSKEKQSITSDLERLRMICHGTEPSEAVLAKFGPGMSNERMAAEWKMAFDEATAKSGRDGVTLPLERRNDSISPRKKKAVYDRDGAACRRCGSVDDPTVDHIVPSAIGGDAAIENLQVLCRQCNSKRPYAGKALLDDVEEWCLGDQIGPGRMAILRRNAALTEASGTPTKNQEPRSKNHEPGAKRPSASRPRGGSSWSREACDDWIERFDGTAPGGRIGKALKPLVERHGWPEVRKAWRSYLAQTEAEYASQERFAATYGKWAGSVGAPRKMSRQEEIERANRESLGAWVAEGNNEPF